MRLHPEKRRPSPSCVGVHVQAWWWWAWPPPRMEAHAHTHLQHTLTARERRVHPTAWAAVFLAFAKRANAVAVQDLSLSPHEWGAQQQLSHDHVRLQAGRCPRCVAAQHTRTRLRLPSSRCTPDHETLINTGKEMRMSVCLCLPPSASNLRTPSYMHSHGAAQAGSPRGARRLLAVACAAAVHTSTQYDVDDLTAPPSFHSLP